MKKLFTSESVTMGHPDKVCDQIADAILDSLLEKDPTSRVACEVMAEPGKVHIMGEITSNAQVDYKAIARKVIRDIGYTKDEYGFTDKCEIEESVHKQSPDISMGVDSSYDEEGESGAGDQGIMFGYAIDESESLMPLALVLSRKLTDALSKKRESGEIPYLRPDGKSQVTLEYDGREVKRIEAVVISAQHDDTVSLEDLRKDIKEKVILPTLPKNLIDENTKFYINPTGRFVYGGPAADTGLTGRKLIVDTYGSKAHHGGGAFSGKDPSKVDRSAAYALRNIAKSIVKSGIAREAELQISYAIGVAKPLSLELDTFSSSKVSEDKILECVEKHYDLRPSAIIKHFDLRKPQYLNTAKYGHFGIEDYPWEKVDEDFIKDLQKLI